MPREKIAASACKAPGLSTSVADIHTSVSLTRSGGGKPIPDCFAMIIHPNPQLRPSRMYVQIPGRVFTHESYLTVTAGGTRTIKAKSAYSQLRPLSPDRPLSLGGIGIGCSP